MLFRYRSYCLDCRHQWDWVRSRIECGHIHFQKSETNRWYFCQRCFLDLFVPRRLNRSTWLRWVSENASELSRSPLMFKACELGVVVDRQSLEVIARSPLLFRACEIVASILAGSRSSYVPASIEIGTMECPGCGDRMAIGDFNTDPLACPECESRTTRSIGAPAPVTFLVDYWPLDDKEVRRVVLHLKQLAEYSGDSQIEGKLAFVTSDREGFLWDKELDGLE